MTKESSEKIYLKDILSQENIYIREDINTRLKSLKFCSEKIHNAYFKGKISLKILQEKFLEIDETNIILNTGVYLPHIKITDLEDIKAVLLINPLGIKDSNTENLFYFTFLFVSPLKTSFFQKHLNTLSIIASFFNTENISKILKLKSPEEIYSYIINIDK